MSRFTSAVRLKSVVVLLLLALVCPLFPSIAPNAGRAAAAPVRTSGEVRGPGALEPGREREDPERSNKKLKKNTGSWSDLETRICYNMTVPLQKVIAISMKRDCKQQCSAAVTDWYDKFGKPACSRSQHSCVKSDVCMRERSYSERMPSNMAGSGSCAGQSSAQRPIAEKKQCLCYMEAHFFRILQLTANVAARTDFDPYVVNPSDVSLPGAVWTDTHYSCIPKRILLKLVRGGWDKQPSAEYTVVTGRSCKKSSEEYECNCRDNPEFAETRCRLMRTRHDADPALIEQPPTAAATTDHDHERDNALALLQNQQSNQLDQRADDSDVTSHELPDLNVSLPPQDDDNDNALEELLDLNESPQDDDGDDNVKGMPTLDDRSLPQGNDKNSPSCAVQMQPVYQPELGIYGTGTYLMTSQAEDTCTSPQEDNDKFCVPDLNL